jgi:hypothetical protein
MAPPDDAVGGEGRDGDERQSPPGQVSGRADVAEEGAGAGKLDDDERGGATPRGEDVEKGVTPRERADVAAAVLASTSASTGEPHARLASIADLRAAGPLAAAHARLLRGIAFNQHRPPTGTADDGSDEDEDDVIDEDPDTRAAALLAWRAVANLTRDELGDAARALAACLLPGTAAAAAAGRGASRGGRSGAAASSSHASAAAAQPPAPRRHVNATQEEVVAAVDLVGRLGEHAPPDLARACVALVHPRNHPLTTCGGASDFRLLWAAAVEAACRIAARLPALAVSGGGGSSGSGEEGGGAGAVAMDVDATPEGDGEADEAEAKARAEEEKAEEKEKEEEEAEAAASHAQSAEVLAPLAEMLADSKSAHARGGAARVLGCAPPALVVPHVVALVGLAGDPAPWVRHAAAVTVGAVPPSLLDDDDGGDGGGGGGGGGARAGGGSLPTCKAENGNDAKVTDGGAVGGGEGNAAAAAALVVPSKLDTVAALLVDKCGAVRLAATETLVGAPHSYVSCCTQSLSLWMPFKI